MYYEIFPFVKGKWTATVATWNYSEGTKRVGYWERILYGRTRREVLAKARCAATMARAFDRHAFTTIRRPDGISTMGGTPLAVLG